KCNERERNSRDGQVSHCEIREQNTGFGGRLTIDAGINGGVSVKGWDQGGVLVRAQVQTWGTDEGAAQATASQVRIDSSAGLIRATGPEQMERRQGWSVSFEIFVPHNADVSAKAHNGGISISDVRGRIEFEAMNGGVSLKRLAGDVEGKTMNGGLNI